MAAIKSYTDINQSKKLAKILPLESADMHYPDYYFDDNAKGPCNTPYKEAIEDLFHVYINPKTKRLLPCWSLAALLRLLTENKICHYDDRYYCQYMNEGDEFPIYSTVEYDNPVDACVEMIEKLHELKML